MTIQPSDLPPAFYRVSVKALVFDAQDRLLVSMNKDHEWEIPGGGLERGETLEACARRELAEELQAVVTEVSQPIFCYQGITQHGYPKLCLLVKVKLKSTALIPTGDDLIETRFVTKEDLLKLPFQKSEVAVKDYVDQIWSAS